jgi:hypothetical protein
VTDIENNIAAESKHVGRGKAKDSESTVKDMKAKDSESNSLQSK